MNGLKRKPAYSEKELRIVDQKPGYGGFMPPTDLFDTPVSVRENMNSHYFDKDPWYCATLRDTTSLQLEAYNVNLSRPHKHDSIDFFGVPWKWVESAGGSITPGGNPRFEDANEWRDVISIPDVDSWDWEGMAKDFRFDPRFSHIFTFLNGFWFERLISLMDFENAAMALVDPDQEDAVHDLFGAMTDMGIKLVDKICEYFPGIDGFTVHDDWGAQKAPFFSDQVARDYFLPYMKDFVGHIHSKGRYCVIHSCGKIEDRIHIFVEAGIDGWEMMNINDVRKLYTEFGEQLCFQAWPLPFDPEDDNAAKEAAREFVDFFCHPGKPALLGMGNREALGSKVFMEEVYEDSRKRYLGLV